MKTQGSASPVFLQLRLEPNHAGLTAQSLFLLEELLCRVKRSGTLNILKLLKLFKKNSKLLRTSSRLLQIKRLQLKLKITYQTPTKASQNNMFLRHGSNNIQNIKNPQKTKNPRPSSSMHKLVPFGSKLVPTWFLPGSYGFR